VISLLANLTLSNQSDPIPLDETTTLVRVLGMITAISVRSKYIIDKRYFLLNLLIEFIVINVLAIFSEPIDCMYVAPRADLVYILSE
jgi:hypothetical protein